MADSNGISGRHEALRNLQSWGSIAIMLAVVLSSFIPFISSREETP
jgi:hypothetical protein